MKVDGKSVKTESITGFLSFDISQGPHKVELSYVPSGYVPGLLLTLAGIGLLVVIILIQRGKIKLDKDVKKVYDDVLFLEDEIE